MTGQTLRYAPDALARLVASTLVGGRPVELLSTPTLNLQSKITRDLELPLEFTVDNILMTTSAGLGFPIESETTKRLLSVQPDRVSDLFLGAPSHLEMSFVLHPVAPVGRDVKGCSLESPWVRMDRKVVYGAREIRVMDKVERKVPFVPLEALKSEPFKRLQSQLRTCFETRALVFKPLDSKESKIKMRSRTKK